MASPLTETTLFDSFQRFFQLTKKLPLEEQEPLAEALAAAAEFHGATRRKSGPLYLAHPLLVATILLKEGADAATVMAALLHDTLEDTSATSEELERRFGGEVTRLVEGVTNLKVFSKRENQEKTYQRSRQDPRIAMLKIADRCANLMNGGFLPMPFQSHADNLSETEEYHLAQLSHIPSVPTSLITLLKHSLAESKESYRNRTK